MDMFPFCLCSVMLLSLLCIKFNKNINVKTHGRQWAVQPIVVCN